jgi:hypothetical protein
MKNLYNDVQSTNRKKVTNLDAAGAIVLIEVSQQHSTHLKKQQYMHHLTFNHNIQAAFVWNRHFLLGSNSSFIVPL